MIITDVFGNMNMHVKNQKKLEKGEAKDKELFKKITSINTPEKNFKEKILSRLNYTSFHMKKYRKFNSRLINKKEKRNLIYTTRDSTNLLLDVIGKVNKYSWRKSDSTLLFISHYYSQKSAGSNGFNVPYSNSEYSNPDGEFSSGYVSMETLLKLGETQSNIFYYFAMEKIIEDQPKLSDYKSIESFEEIYSNTKTKPMGNVPDPKIYPLKFPASIFF